MMSEEVKMTLEQRLQAIEDRLEIYQVICGYGYAVDGLNADAVGSFYAEDGVYAVADLATFKGRERVAGITQRETHVGYVRGGCAHTSTLPYVVIDGDRAVATCHTLILRNGEEGFYVFRGSASRIQLSRKPEGGWQIDHRQVHLLNG